MREIAGEHVLVPSGQAAVDFSGIMSLNESGVLLWNCLQKECTEKDLLDALLAEYEIDETTAQADLNRFLEKVRSTGILIKE